MGGSPQVPPLPLHSSLFCLCVLLWWLTPPAPTALSGAEVPHSGSVRAAGARRPPLGPAAPTTAPRPPSLWRERPPSRAPAPSATSQSASGTSAAHLPVAIAGASLLGVLLWALPPKPLPSKPQQKLFEPSDAAWACCWSWMLAAEHWRWLPEPFGPPGATQLAPQVVAQEALCFVGSGTLEMDQRRGRQGHRMSASPFYDCFL